MRGSFIHPAARPITVADIGTVITRCGGPRDVRIGHSLPTVDNGMALARAVLKYGGLPTVDPLTADHLAALRGNVQLQGVLEVWARMQRPDPDSFAQLQQALEMSQPRPAADFQVGDTGTITDITFGSPQK